MVREAATLNLMFLSDLAGLDPLPPVCALVTSFEACADDRAPHHLHGAAQPVTAGVTEQRSLRTQELMATLRTEVRLKYIPLGSRINVQQPDVVTQT